MSSLLPTTSDAQCSRSSIFSGGCEADDGYDPSTCTMYGLKCYSNTARQCRHDDECFTSVLSGGECINESGGGSLYCRRGGPFYSCVCEMANYRVNTWPSMAQSGAYFFPEQCLPRWSNVSGGTSLALAGGGNRSFAASIGILRALTKLRKGATDAYRACDYVSTASGSSWFMGAYQFAQGKHGYSDAVLLGSSLPLDQCTLKNLDSANFEAGENTPFLGGRMVEQDYVLNLLKALIIGNDVPFDDWWNYVITQIFLAPYGLDHTAPIALDADHASEIDAANTGLGPALTPAPNSPLWLCTIAMYYRPLSSVGVYPMITASPLYTGSPQIIGAEDGTYVGGAWTDTFAMGASAPQTPTPVFATSCDPTVATVTPIENTITTLGDVIASSSSATGSILYRDSGLSLDGALPNYEAWSPYAPGETVTTIHTDGGFVDVFGLVALAARGATRVLCSYCPPGVWNPAGGILMTKDPLEDLYPLFGMLPDGYVFDGGLGAYNRTRNGSQIFDKSSWPAFRDMLASTKAAGGPTWVRMKLSVLPNSLFGVSGNYTMDIFMLMLQPSSKFNAMLPTDTRAEIAKGSSGKLANFPVYPLFLQNFTSVSSLTRQQTNLLAIFGEWLWSQPEVVTQISSLFE
jgi:hypothetical protein